jgi:enediyne biosynthesis protein E4
LTTEADVENASSNGLYNTSWGTTFWDFDNDGFLDLFVANGHLPTAPFVQNNLLDPNKLYRNMGDGTFEDLTEEQQVGSTLMARGCAYADYDQDGDLDMAVVNLEQGEFVAVNHVELFQNPGNENHYIQFELEGTLSGNDAFGAWVIVHAGDRHLLREIHGGSSHASQSTSRVHVGLGNLTEVDSVNVIWPVGNPETWFSLEADSLHTLEQGTSVGITSDLTQKLQIFPNPASSVAYVSGLSHDAQLITVTDLQGREIQGFLAHKEASVWVLSWSWDMAPGMYVVRIEQQGIKRSFRLLLE